MTGVFLSYAHSDQEAARQVANALREAGIEVFDASAGPAGTNLSKAISDGIEAADAFVFLISPRYSQRQWTQIELAAAMSRLTGSADAEARFVPVLIGADLDPETDVPNLLRRFAWVDFRDGVNQRGLDLIVGAVTAPIPAESFSQQLDAEEAVLSIRAEGLRQRQEIRRLELAAEFEFMRRTTSARMSLVLALTALVTSAIAIAAVLTGAFDDGSRLVLLTLGVNLVVASSVSVRLVLWYLQSRVAMRAADRHLHEALQRGASRARPD